VLEFLGNREFRERNFAPSEFEGFKENYRVH